MTKQVSLLNLAAVYEKYSELSKEEELREESERLFSEVVNEVGSNRKAGERLALNRLHWVLNKIRLGKEQEASEIAKQLQGLQIVGKLPREFFHKLVYYQLVLAHIELSKNEAKAIQANSDANF